MMVKIYSFICIFILFGEDNSQNVVSKVDSTSPTTTATIATSTATSSTTITITLATAKFSTIRLFSPANLEAAPSNCVDLQTWCPSYITLIPNCNNPYLTQTCCFSCLQFEIFSPDILIYTYTTTPTTTTTTTTSSTSMSTTTTTTTVYLSSLLNNLSSFTIKTALPLGDPNCQDLQNWCAGYVVSVNTCMGNFLLLDNCCNSCLKFTMPPTMPTTTPTTTPITSTMQCTGIQNADLVFAVDESGSICDSDPAYQFDRDATCNNFNNVLTFISQLVGYLTIGPYNTRVGLTSFDTEARVNWPLEQYTNFNDLQKAIKSIQYTGGNTFTTQGLRLACNLNFNPSKPNLIIIITDGKPTVFPQGLPQVVKDCCNKGISIISIGVTSSIDVNTLSSMPCPPTQLDVNYFVASSFNMLETVLNKILQISNVGCRPGTPLPTTIRTTSGPTIRTTFTYPPCTPGKYFDIVFVIDESGSICDTDPDFVFGRDTNCNNFRDVLNFMNYLIGGLIIGPQASLVGMVSFDTSASILWNLNAYPDKNMLHDAVTNIGYNGGFTDTTDGIRLMLDIFKNPSNRPNVPDLAIVITDGKPNVNVNMLPGQLLLAKQNNVKIISIGVTNSVDEATLQLICSPPPLKNFNYFIIDEFSSISQVQEMIFKNIGIC